MKRSVIVLESDLTACVAELGSVRYPDVRTIVKEHKCRRERRQIARSADNEKRFCQEVVPESNACY